MTQFSLILTQLKYGTIKIKPIGKLIGSWYSTG